MPYDRLILAVGSVTTDFGTLELKIIAILDSLKQADAFHAELLDKFLKSEPSSRTVKAELSLAIVGGGATGVELAAELVHSVSLLSIYGLKHLDRSHFRFS